MTKTLALVGSSVMFLTLAVCNLAVRKFSDLVDSSVISRIVSKLSTEKPFLQLRDLAMDWGVGGTGRQP